MEIMYVREFNQDDFPGMTRDEAFDAYIHQNEPPNWAYVVLILTCLAFVIWKHFHP